MSLLDVQYFSRQAGDLPTPIRQLRNVTSYSVMSGDKIILVDTSKSAVNIYLPPAKSTQAGGQISVKDSSGHALTNNITLICRSDVRHPNYIASGGKLDGQTAVALNATYSGVKLMSDGTNWLLIP